MALLLSDSFFPEARHLQRRRRMTDFFDDFFSNLDFLPPMHKKRRLRDLTDQKAGSPSETSQKDGGFSLDLDIHGFAPEQLQVSVDGNSLVIEGTHSSKSESGSIRRNFVQKVKIPKGVDVNSIKSSLGSKGRLYITGEAKKPAAVEGNKRKIPIAAISENEK